MKINIPSIFDLEDDEDGTLRMPFNPVDYGEYNHILRECHMCKEKFEQGTMKELGGGGGLRSGASKHQLYDDGFFTCAECWPKCKYSDASGWVA